MSNIPNLAQNMAAPFDTSKDYESGEFVVYDGLLYIFNTSHTAGAWNNDEVTKVTLADAMKGTVNSNLGYKFKLSTYLNTRTADQTSSYAIATLDVTNRNQVIISDLNASTLYMSSYKKDGGSAVKLENGTIDVSDCNTIEIYVRADLTSGSYINTEAYCWVEVK